MAFFQQPLISLCHLPDVQLIESSMLNFNSFDGFRQSFASPPNEIYYQSSDGSMDSLKRLKDGDSSFSDLQNMIDEGKEVYILASSNEVSTEDLNKYIHNQDTNESTISDQVIKRVLHARIRYANGIFRHFGNATSKCIFYWTLLTGIRWAMWISD